MHIIYFPDGNKIKKTTSMLCLCHIVNKVQGKYIYLKSGSIQTLIYLNAFGCQSKIRNAYITIRINLIQCIKGNYKSGYNNEKQQYT